MAICIKAIGRNVRKLRKEKNMTQEEIAAQLNMSELHYGRLERGERNVSLIQLDRIAGIFGVPTDVLLDGAFPDEAIELAGKRDTHGFVERLEHLAQSLDEKERRIVLELCRLMAHDD